MVSQFTPNHHHRSVNQTGSWKILLVDDDQHTHKMIKLFLRNLLFDDLPLQVISAYSAAEARDLIPQHPDTALIFLDMVMENLDSGLRVAEFIRDKMGNKLVQIVMLTGQMQLRAEEEIIIRYDINDYWIKTEFSRQKLTTTVLTSLRAYRDLMTIEAHRQELAELSAHLTARSTELESLNQQLKSEIARREQVEQALWQKNAFTETELRAASILIIEDNPTSLDTLSSILAHNGYQVRCAANGEMGLESAIAQPPDLILLDINLPGIDGFTVCEQFKANPTTRDIPVIFTSAYDSLQNKVRAFAAGGVDFMTKPVSVEEMLVRVSTHLVLRSTQKQLQQTNNHLAAEITNCEQAQQKLVELRNQPKNVIDIAPDFMLNIIVSAAAAIANAHGAVALPTGAVSTCLDGDWVEVRISESYAGVTGQIEPETNTHPAEKPVVFVADNPPAQETTLVVRLPLNGRASHSAATV